MNEDYVRLIERIKMLREAGASERLLTTMGYYAKPDCFSNEPGDLRAGELGQWDLYYHLWQDFGHSKLEAMAGAGLNLNQIAAAEREDELRDNYVDPDNPFEVREFERIKDMTTEQLDSEIVRLEGLLS